MDVDARSLAYLAGCHAPESRLLGNMRADAIARVALEVPRLRKEIDALRAERDKLRVELSDALAPFG